MFYEVFTALPYSELFCFPPLSVSRGRHSQRDSPWRWGKSDADDILIGVCVIAGDEGVVTGPDGPQKDPGTRLIVLHDSRETYRAAGWSVLDSLAVLEAECSVGAELAASVLKGQQLSKRCPCMLCHFVKTAVVKLCFVQ